MLSLVPGMGLTAKAAEATTLTAETTTWENGDYVVPAGGLTISGHITVNGTVNLTLPAGTTLTANTGITLSDGATLNVSGEGAMTVNGTNNSTASTVAGNGMLVLTSGTLTAKGGNGQGIGDRQDNQTGANGGTAINGSVIMNGGTLTATGGNGGSVGGSCYNCKGGNGDAAISGNLTVNGGTMTATNGTAGSLGSRPINSSAGAAGASIGGTLTLGKNVTLYDGLYNVLDDNNSSSREYKGDRTQIMHAVYEVTYAVTQITHTPAAAEGTVSMTYGDSSSTLLPGETSLDDVKGKTVTLNITPGSGYRVKSVTVEKPAEATITLDNTTTGWRDGTYAVPAGGLTYSDAITVSGDVTLVLTDGETLTLNKGIALAEGATLTIQGEGTMNVNGTNSSTASTVAGCTGMLVLTSGTLTAKGGEGQGFSSFGDNRNGAVGGVAINGNVTVEGGTLTATGGNGGSMGSDAGPDNRGGNGGVAISGSLTINGGTVTTTNGSNGTNNTQSWEHSSAGSGGKAVAGTVTDNTGTNTETGGAGNESNPEETAAIIEAEKQTDGSWQFTMPDYSVTLNIEYEEGADKTSLNDAITAAEELYDSIKDNDDYTGIANTLKAAIDTAKNVADNEEADQDAVDTAATNITTAKTTAETAILNALNEIINNAGEGDTITLDCPVVGDITIPTGKKITLDLNGQTITGGVAVENGADLTIKPEGTITGDITNNGTLTVNGGTFNGDVTNNGTLTVNSGTFASGKTVTTTTENGHTTINGGTFKGNVTSTVSGTTTIKGGLFDNMPSATDSGTVVFQGGYYKSEIASGAVTTPYKAQSKTDQTNAESDDNATEAEKAAWANDSYTYRVVCVYTALTVDNAPTISGGHNPPQVGDTLTANTTATDLTYQWYRGNEAIEGATSASYTAVAADVGKTIKVTVTQTKDADGNDLTTNKPTQTSDPTAAVTLRDNANDAPTLATGDVARASTTLTVSASKFPTDTYEYSKDGGTTWQAGNEFTGLTAGNYYQIAVREKATDTTAAGAASNVLSVRTVVPPKSSEGLALINYTTEKFKSELKAKVNGTEYTYEISSTNAFSATISGGADVTPGSTYYIRYAAVAGVSEASSAVAFTVPQRPSAPDPKLFTAVNTTAQEATDGKIIGVNDKMEWATTENGTYTAVAENATELTGKGVGDYYIRYKATDTAFSSKATKVTIANGAIVLSGVTITGTAKYGETLTATITPANATGTISYAWYRSGTAISGATSSTYQLAAADIGSTITVKVTQNSGTPVESKATAAVTAVEGSRTKPLLSEKNIVKTENTIQVVGFANTDKVAYEYSRDGGVTWQAGNEFTDLNSNTPYRIAVREKEVKEGDVVVKTAGVSSDVLTVRTEANKVTLHHATLTGDAKVGNTLTAAGLTEGDNPQIATGLSYAWYRVDVDETETLITGATGSTYTLVNTDYGKKITVKVTQSGTAKEASTTSAVAQAPAVTPTASRLKTTATQTTVTVSGYANTTTRHYEYAITAQNGTPTDSDWQDETVFTGLSTGTTYTLHVRTGGVADKYAWQETGDTTKTIKSDVTTRSKTDPFTIAGVQPTVVMPDYTYGTPAPTPALTLDPESGATVQYYYSAAGFKATDAEAAGTLWTGSQTLTAGTYYMRAYVPENTKNSTQYGSYLTAQTKFVVDKAPATAPTVTAQNPGTTVTVSGVAANGTVSYAVVDKNAAAPAPTAYQLVTLSSGKFTITGLAANYDYDVYVCALGDANHTVSAPGKATGKTPAQYTVAYNANGGSGRINTQTFPQDNFATVKSVDGDTNDSGFIRPGYTFSKWHTTPSGSGGTDYAPAAQINTSATLYAQWTANSYKIVFDGNGSTGGSTAEKENVTYGSNATLTLNGFTKTDYVFVGWATSENGPVAYADGQTVKNLTTTPNGEVKLYAVWALQTAKVTGAVTSAEGGTVTLRLKRGDVQIGTTQNLALILQSDGSYKCDYSFEGIPNGTYNVVVEQEVERVKADGSPYTEKLTKTAAVTITNGASASAGTLAMPVTDTSSVVNVTGTDTPPVVVGGLDTEAAKNEVEERSVSMTLTVEKQEKAAEGDASADQETQAAISEIESVSTSDTEQRDFLNIDVTKEVTKDGEVESTQAVTQTTDVLELIIPYDMTGKHDYQIMFYRHHGGEAAKLNRHSGNGKPASSYGNGHFYIDLTNNLIYLWTNQFSTYAIGYDPEATESDNQGTTPNSYTPSGGGNTTYAPTIADTQHGKITVSPTSPTSGAKVSITAKPDEGYEVDAVTVTDANGKTVAVTKNADGTYTFTQPSSKVKIDVTFKEASTTDALAKFSDINASDWYAEAVRWALDNGVMNGVGNGKFNPNGDTSRAMIVTMLWRMEGSPAYVGASEFSDVENADWYGQAVRWASAEGIVEGYTQNGSKVFNPNGAVTREQLAAILYRYAQFKKADVSVGEDTNILSYDDAFSVSGWATSAMQWAVGSGIINGIGSELVPAGNASRAQVATMLMRYSTVK